MDMIVKPLSINDIDILRLRAVCSWWRCSIPPSKNSPFWISFVKPKFYQFPPFELTQKTILLISPLDNDANKVSPVIPRMIQVEETGPKKLSLIDPFIFQPESFFPKCRVDLPDDHINLLDYKVGVLNRSYYTGLYFNCRVTYCRRVIVVTDNIIAAVEHFMVFVLFGNGLFVVWKHRTNEWIPIGEEDHNFREIILYKNKIYEFENCGQVMVIDLATCKAENAPCTPEFTWNCERCYMTEWNGHLYLVTCCFTREPPQLKIRSLYVCVLNDENASWDRTYDLDGGVFFVVSGDTLFSVLAKDIGVPKGNVLYFDSVLVRAQIISGVRVYFSVVYDLLHDKDDVNKEAESCTTLTSPPLGYVAERPLPPGVCLTESDLVYPCLKPQ